MKLSGAMQCYIITMSHDSCTRNQVVAPETISNATVTNATIAGASPLKQPIKIILPRLRKPGTQSVMVYAAGAATTQQPELTT